MQTITTPTGEKLVVIPLEHYEALIDAADVASAEKVAASVLSGEEELVPASVVKELVEGGNPVRVWRRYRGLTARDLASKAGISPAFLSEIETGRKEGSVSALKRLAGALKVDLDDLV
ncbi:MAG: helix-turn-helix domain-containing protein [Caulobacterales bacterium]|uniref:helix-turn-helix domain-containing protein n=1 Tax=Glycocaulis sp. TaxID=1969725 RepID=UPI003F9F451C